MNVLPDLQTLACYVRILNKTAEYGAVRLPPSKFQERRE